MSTLFPKYRKTLQIGSSLKNCRIKFAEIGEILCSRWRPAKQNIQANSVCYNQGQKFLNTLDSTFSINLGENWNFLSMLQFEQELSKYLVSNIVLKYNIKPWGCFHPVYCWCMLLWVVSSVFRNQWPRHRLPWSSTSVVLNLFQLAAH
jgi:hypothetical protein